MAEADTIVNIVNRWLGNPFSRLMLGWVSKRGNNGVRLDNALKRYAGYETMLCFSDRIAYKIVSGVLNKGASSFGISEDQIKESLKAPVVRRGLSNILEGIGKYGVRRPQLSAAPFLVVWDFTKQCNLKCKHCYENAESLPAKNELSTEEAKDVIDQFSEIGVVAIAFSGGEPLIRKDFFEMVRYAREKDFYISVASNATLITPDIAKKLKATGVDYIEISLDGFEKEHDEFRGVPGAWKKTCRGIKNCVKAGIDTCVATTVTHHNLIKVPKLIDFVEKGLKANRMIFFNYVPTRRGSDIAKDDLTPQEREEFLKYIYMKLIDKKCNLDVFSTAPQYSRIAMEFSEGPKIATHFTNKQATEMLQGRTTTLTEFIGGCGAGRLYCGLEPNGDIQPCVFIPIKIGNIRKDKLKDIWEKSPILNKMRDRDELKGCGECKYRYVCGGCRARAYGYFGDVAGPDPGCINNLKYWEEVKKNNPD
jgi:radical SAM protein with 4Fe4S-binding SPASM domain